MQQICGDAEEPQRRLEPRPIPWHHMYNATSVMIIPKRISTYNQPTIDECLDLIKIAYYRPATEFTTSLGLAARMWAAATSCGSEYVCKGKNGIEHCISRPYQEGPAFDQLCRL